ncbi:hypothetical protein HQQ81_14490 [Microbacteriaceae bacterium VKM Ac-2854]|nr:hypothetical protein [Microbacteriaceae bacterium VKM Ac-2854]
MKPRKPLPEPLSNVVFTVSAARDAGVQRGRLRGTDLAAPFRGVRVPADFNGSVLHRARALQGLLPAITFSDLTAARLWGLDLPIEAEDEPLFVAVRAPKRAPQIAGVRGRQITDPDVRAVTRNGFALIDAASIFCQLAAHLELADLVAVGDALVRDPPVLHPGDPRPWVTLDALRDRVARFRGRGCRLAREAIPLVRVGAESRQESRLRVAIVRAGLPEPEPNVEIRGADGRLITRVDLYYPSWDVGVEYEGGQHEAGRQLARDIARYDDLAAHGTRIVRVDKSFIRAPDASLARIERALRERGWVP